MRRATKKAPPVPPLAEREKPGLSETLSGPVHPARCQSCSGRHSPSNALGRWVECDAWDKPTRVVVVLCLSCSGRLIEPHPRLYRALSANEPYPGCMSLCLRCPQRRGTSCRSPLAKMNGGAGLRFDCGPKAPDWMHINYGGGRGATLHTFHMPMQDCSGRPMVWPERAP